jgi:hypothetical protein
MASRDLFIVATTAIATAVVSLCIAAATGLGQPERRITLRDGSTAYMPRIDWKCFYFNGAVLGEPWQVQCSRTVGRVGVWVRVTPELVRVYRSTYPARRHSRLLFAANRS